MKRYTLHPVSLELMEDSSGSLMKFDEVKEALEFMGCSYTPPMQGFPFGMWAGPSSKVPQGELVAPPAPIEPSAPAPVDDQPLP